MNCRLPRHLVVVGISLIVLFGPLASGTWSREPVDLRRASDHHDAIQYQASVDVSGTLRMPAEKDEIREAQVQLSGKFDYIERSLESRWDGDLPIVRAVRLYHTAEAKLTILGNSRSRSLANDRRLLVAQSDARRVTLFSPLGPLTSDELELLSIPVNPLALDALAPNRTVALGESWQIAATVLAMLLGLDDVSEAKVSAQVVEANPRAAKLTFSGRVDGSVEGVSTELELEGKFLFDLRFRKVSWLALLIRERRAVGHAAPGLDVSAKVVLSSIRTQLPPGLSDHAIADLELHARPELLLLRYQSAQSGLELMHDRRWHLVLDDGKLVVLRFVDHGELIAQCNLAAVSKRERPLTLEEFQQDIRQSLTNHFGEFLSAREGTTTQGYRRLDVAVSGRVDELPIQWNYVHLMAPDGRALGLVITVEPSLLERIQAASESLAESIRFLDSSTLSAFGNSPLPARR